MKILYLSTPNCTATNEFSRMALIFAISISAMRLMDAPLNRWDVSQLRNEGKVTVAITATMARVTASSYAVNPELRRMNYALLL
jgi:low temperature requirement protein LtrA